MSVSLFFFLFYFVTSSIVNFHYIYIYIERERERWGERKRGMKDKYIERDRYEHTYTNTYIQCTDIDR